MTRPQLHVDPLNGRLPMSTPAQAALSRLAFDSRFAGWLRATLNQPGLTVSRRPLAARWLLAVDTDHGRLQVAIDTADWPALQLALELDDPATACAVATLLLSPWADAFTASLGRPRVASLERLSAPSADVAVVSVGPVSVGLRDGDSSLLERLSLLGSQGIGVDISNFAPLPLRSRIRLLARPLPRAVLRSLEPGDVVLAGEQAAVLVCGLGRTLQARIHIHPQEFTVQVAEHPHMTDDDGVPDAPPQPAGTLDELQLPVAFELDTARVSLAELASMQPGYSVELDVPLHEAVVRLVCHGQTLGHGQLVAIGDQLGVRITRLEFANDTAVAS